MFAARTSYAVTKKARFSRREIFVSRPLTNIQRSLRALCEAGTLPRSPRIKWGADTPDAPLQVPSGTESMRMKTCIAITARAMSLGVPLPPPGAHQGTTTPSSRKQNAPKLSASGRCRTNSGVLLFLLLARGGGNFHLTAQASYPTPPGGLHRQLSDHTITLVPGDHPPPPKKGMSIRNPKFPKTLGSPPKPWGPSKTLGSLHVGARAPQAGRRRRARGQPLVRGRRPPGGGRSRGRPAPRARSARRQSRRNLHT